MKDEISEITVGATLDEWTDLIRAALVGLQGIVDMGSHDKGPNTWKVRQKTMRNTDAIVRRILDKAGSLQ